LISPSFISTCRVIVVTGFSVRNFKITFTFTYVVIIEINNTSLYLILLAGKFVFVFKRIPIILHNVFKRNDILAFMHYIILFCLFNVLNFKSNGHNKGHSATFKLYYGK
jgi:hypothetical protein